MTIDPVKFTYLKQSKEQIIDEIELPILQEAINDKNDVNLNWIKGRKIDIEQNPEPVEQIDLVKKVKLLKPLLSDEVEPDLTEKAEDDGFIALISMFISIMFIFIFTNLTNVLVIIVTWFILSVFIQKFIKFLR